MNDVYEEILVKKKKTGADTAKKLGLIAAVVLLAAIGFLFIPLMLLPAAILAILSYYLILWLNVEYEYLYVNGDIDVDKILNRTRRKKVGSFDLANLEYVAPTGSHELDTYLSRPDKSELDFSSGEDNAKTYTAVYVMDKGTKLVKMELTDTILQDLRRQAPRKISRECL